LNRYGLEYVELAPFFDFGGLEQETPTPDPKVISVSVSVFDGAYVSWFVPLRPQFEVVLGDID